MTTAEFVDDYYSLIRIAEFLEENNLNDIEVFEDAFGISVTSYRDFDYAMNMFLRNAVDSGVGWGDIKAGFENTATEDEGYFFIESGEFYCCLYCIDEDEDFINDAQAYIIQEYSYLFGGEEEDEENNSSQIPHNFKQAIEYRNTERVAEDIKKAQEVIRFGADVCVSGLYEIK